MILSALRPTVRDCDWRARSLRCHAGERPRSGNACARTIHRPPPPPAPSSPTCGRRCAGTICQPLVELFVLLLGRVERVNREWAIRTIARTPSLQGESTASVREDLLQELTLHLWSEIALGDDEAWEIFFTRALSFAQRHVATAFMERNGYWVAQGVRTPSRGTAIPFSRLAARFEDDERSGDEWPQLAAPEDGMVAAELADLRELVARLPKRQRAVVIMRYWQDAQERDIAASLGVTPRAVRAMLARAYARLRAAYERADPLVR